MRALWLVHQYLPFCVATPLQEASAIVIETASANNYFDSMRELYSHQRDVLMQLLIDVGMKPMLPDGGYFIVAKVDIQTENICKFLTTDVGVTAIPVGAFYYPKDAHTVLNLVRFAFCKDPKSLQEAGARLKKWFNNYLSCTIP